MAVIYAVIPFLFFDQQHHTLVSGYSMTERAILLGWLFSMSPLGRLFGAPILGKLSDRVGRRKILLFTLTMTAIATSLTAGSLSIGSLVLLFASRLLTGLFSGNIAIAQASLSDISDKQHKTWRLNLLEIGMASGLMLGPVLGSAFISPTFIHHFSYSFPFYLILLANIILVAVLWFMFSETLPDSTLMTHRSQQMMGQLPESLRVDFLDGPKQLLKVFHLPRLWLLFAVWGISMGGYTLYIEFFTGFLKESLHFTPHNLMVLSLYVMAFYALYQVFIVYPLTKRVAPEKMVKPTLILLGILIMVMGFSSNIIMLYFCRLSYMLAMVLFIPNFNALVSNAAGEAIQGQVFGVMSAVYSLASLLIAIVGGILAAWSSAAPVVIGGILILFAGILLLSFKSSFKTVKGV